MHAASVCGALIATLCLTPVTFAQEACRDDEGVQECFNRIQQAGERVANDDERTKILDVEVQNAQEALRADVQETFARSQTGADTGGTATASTLNDLAQLFEALGLLSSGEGSDTLVFNLNFLLPVQDAENHNAQLKAIVNTEAEPLEQLVQAFGETVREARRDSLQKDISTLGDAQLSFTWSLVNTRFGRDYRVLRRLIAPLHAGAVNRGRAATAGTSALLRLQNVLKELSDALAPINAARAQEVPAQAPIPITAPFKDLPFPEADRERFKEATAAAARERSEIVRAIQLELQRSTLASLPELVEQQPQLLFSVSHDFRDEIVGPEKTSATLTWEITRGNLGAFLRGPGAACRAPEVSAGTAQYLTCVTALERYMQDFDNPEKQWRVKLAASWNRVKAVTYQFADDGVNLHLPGHDRLEVTVAAGRRMGENENDARLDFELSYDSNLDDDTTNRERLKATLTYTRRVGDMDVPFSIVYANRDEFLGEVDHRIGMHIGLKFRQPAQ